MTIADISRTNYLSRFENGVLHVKPFARQLTIPIPQDAVTLQLEPSPFSQAAAIDLRKKAANDEEISGICRYGVSNDALHVFFPPKEPVDYKQVRPARLGLWPITRRVLAETRDRVKPMLNFASAR